MPKERPQQHTTTGSISDNRILDLTSIAAWVSNRSPVAHISTGPGSEEVVTGLTEGRPQITATDPNTGIVSPAVTLDVTDGAGSQQPIHSYISPSDRDVRPEPPLPALGPAGSVVLDPTFGNRILRVTDANTMPDQVGRSYNTASGAATKMFNADNTRITAISIGGRLLAYDFDPVRMTIKRIGDPSAPSGGDLIPMQADGAFFSYTDPNRLYSVPNGTNNIGVYDFTTKQVTTLLDIGALGLPGMTGNRCDIAGVSRDDRYIAWFGGGTVQDTDMYVIRYDQQTGDWRALNTETGEVFTGTGSNPGMSQGFVTSSPTGLLHNARMSLGGKFVLMVGGTASSTIWEIAALNTADLVAINGHWAPGHGDWINHCGIGDGARWCVQHYPQAPPGTLLPQTELMPKKWAIDSHPSWLNDSPGLDVPVCLATYRPDGSAIARPWDNEVICVATDSSNAVWRFAHTRTTGTGWINLPRGNVSQDGRFYMFNSDWEETVDAARADVFVVELK